MPRMFFPVLAISISAAGVAHSKPLPAAQHDPPLTLNLPSIWINMISNDDRGYRIKAELMVLGAGGKTDRIRFEWKSGGKVVGTGKCESVFYAETKALSGVCDMDPEVKAKGPIDIDVIFTDDQEDKDFLVTTLKTEIKNWKGIGKTQSWGFIPDDLLAVAFVFNSWNGTSGGGDFRTPLFQFWSTNPFLGTNAVFRCSVDGKRVPDFDAHIDRPTGVGQASIESEVFNERDRRKYTFDHYEVSPGFHIGSKEDFASANRDVTKARMAIDNPGSWDCFLRIEGKPAREFMFVVNDKGMIEPSEMQKAKNPVPTLPHVLLVDMKIPKDTNSEKRLRPEAMKKSIGFGFAWPDSPKAKELQSAFPPASGLAD